MQFTVPSPMSLLEALERVAPESSRNTLRSWVAKGRVSVAGVKVNDPRVAIAVGTEVRVGPRTSFLSGNIEILYEDHHIVVIDKPAGLLTVASAFERMETAHALLKEYKHAPRVYPVHRLDRETSGVMVFAYSQRARDTLKEVFAAHAIERHYIALVEGVPSEKKGSWKSFLQEDTTYFVRSAPQGQLAITHYEVVKSRADYSLLTLHLETGRKNQIRVHCQEAGHPVAGDKKYGAHTDPLGRLALHAHELGLIHPITGKRLRFLSPIPKRFSLLQF